MIMAYAKYLKTLMFLAQSKTIEFWYLVEKVQQQLSGWKHYTLLWFGHNTLINVVI